MAQIKVLDLCNSNSLSELSYEDAKRTIGGGFGASAGYYHYKAGLTGKGLYSSVFRGAFNGAIEGIRMSPMDYAEPVSLLTTAAIGASLSS